MRTGQVGWIQQRRRWRRLTVSSRMQLLYVEAHQHEYPERKYICVGLALPRPARRWRR